MSIGRAITHHHVGIEELDSAYEITALDKPGPASKCYSINAVDSVRGHQSVSVFKLQFQDGSPQMLGLNGLSDELLLAILIDRAYFSKQKAVENALRCAMFEMRHAILERHQKKRE